MTKRECCEPKCTESPSFIIQDEDPKDPYSGTEACGEHVGRLLRQDVPARVIPIEG